jgi:hypothetical protein
MDYDFGKSRSSSSRHSFREVGLIVSLETSFHSGAPGSRTKWGWNIRSVNLGWRAWQDCVLNFFLKEDLYDTTLSFRPLDKDRGVRLPKVHAAIVRSSACLAALDNPAAVV